MTKELKLQATPHTSPKFLYMFHLPTDLTNHKFKDKIINDFKMAATDH